MPTERPLEEYHRRRNRILALLDHARPLMKGTYAQAWPALAQYREELTVAMQDLQQYKHAAIFDPIIAAGRSDRAMVEALKTDCIMLSMEYQTYRQRWAKIDIQARWPEYLLAAISMMATIRKGLATQDDVIRELRPM